jgi:hypothetical protein
MNPDCYDDSRGGDSFITYYSSLFTRRRTRFEAMMMRASVVTIDAECRI